MECEPAGMVTRSGRRFSIDKAELKDEDNHSTCSTPTKRRVKRLSIRPELEDLPETEVSSNPGNLNIKIQQPLEARLIDPVKKDLPLHTISDNIIDSPSRNLRKRNLSLSSPMETKPRENITPKKAVRKIETSLMHNFVDSPKLRKNKRLSGGVDADTSQELSTLRRSRRLSGELNIVLEDPIREEQQESSKAVASSVRKGKRLSVVPVQPPLPEECEDIKEIQQSSPHYLQDVKETNLTNKISSQLNDKSFEVNICSDKSPKLSCVKVTLEKIECSTTNPSPKHKNDSPVLMTSPIIHTKILRQSPRIRLVSKQDEVEDSDNLKLLELTTEVTNTSHTNEYSEISKCFPMDVDIFETSVDTSKEEAVAEKKPNTSNDIHESTLKDNTEVKFWIQCNSDVKCGGNSSSITSPLRTVKSPDVVINNTFNENISNETSDEIGHINSIEKNSFNLFQEDDNVKIDTPKQKFKRLSLNKYLEQSPKGEVSFVKNDESSKASQCVEDTGDLSNDVIPGSQEINVKSSSDGIRAIIKKSSMNSSVGLKTVEESSFETENKDTSQVQIQVQNVCMDNHANSKASISEENILINVEIDSVPKFEQIFSKSPSTEPSLNTQCEEKAESSLNSLLNNSTKENQNNVTVQLIANENVEAIDNSAHSGGEDDSIMVLALEHPNESYSRSNENKEVSKQEFSFNTNNKAKDISNTSDKCLSMNVSRKSSVHDIQSNNSSDSDNTVDKESVSGENEDFVRLQLLDESASEAGSDYKSGDSLGDSEKEDMEFNEIIEKGESLCSESDDEESDVSNYEKDSFICTSDDEKSISGLIEGSNTPEESSQLLSVTQSSVKMPLAMSPKIDNVEENYENAGRDRMVEGTWIVSPLKSLIENVPGNSRKRKLARAQEKDVEWTGTAGEFSIADKILPETPTCPVSASDFGSTTSFNVVSLKKSSKHNILTVDSKLSTGGNFKENMLYGNHIKRKDSKSVKNIQQKIRASNMHRNK